MRQMAERVGSEPHGTLAGTAVFKTAALNHSATFPSWDERLAKRPAEGKEDCAGRLSGAEIIGTGIPGPVGAGRRAC